MERGTLLHPLWTALADRLDRRFDSCVLESTASFQFLPGRRVKN